MLRKQALWVALGSLGISPLAYALGLGDIQVRSQLNEPFYAVVPVLNSVPGEAESLSVRLGSVSDYARSGVDLSDYLLTLHFDVEGGAEPAIVIRGDAPAREPLMSLLLEIRSRGAGMLREYTVLLDPPELAGRTRAAAAAAPSTASPRPLPAPSKPVAVPTPEPASTPAPLASEPVVETPPPNSRAALLAEPATPTPIPAKSAPAPTPEPVASRLDGDRYGPISDGETFWSVATRLRPNESITMDQMLLAIYEANPSAFAGGINGLLRGSTLRVPSEEEYLATSAPEAHAKVAALRAGRSAATASTSTAPASSKSTSFEAAPTSSRESASETASLSTPAPSSAPKSLPPPPTVHSDPLGLLGGKLPSTGLSAEPATASSSSAAAAPSSETADETTTEPVAEAPAESMPATSESPGELPADVGSTAVAAPTAEGGSASIETTPAVGEAPAAAIPAEPTPAPAAEKPKPTPKPAPQPEPELPLLPLGLGAALVLLLALFGYRKFQQRREEKALERNAANEPRIGAPMVTAAAVAAAGMSREGTARSKSELELLQEAESDADGNDSGGLLPPEGQADRPAPALHEEFVLPADESGEDPIAEADANLSYGLHDEAVAILQAALARQPQREDVRRKLAEALFVAGRSDEYEALVAPMKERLPAEEWDHYATMGRQLNPTSPVFNAAALGTAAAIAAGASLDFGAGELSVGEPMAQPTGSAQLDPGTLDFDLGELTTVTGSSESPTVDAASLEFDLSDFDLALDTGAASPSAATKPDNTLEFDLSGFDLDEPKPTVVTAEPTVLELPEAAPIGAASMLEFDLAEPPVQAQVEEVSFGDPQLDLGPLTDSSPDFSSQTQTLELANFDAVPEFTAPPAPVAAAPAPTPAPVLEPLEDLPSFDLEDFPQSEEDSFFAGDEVSTKLDLARAYVDMGDHEMARSLLEEVASQGTPDQQREAQQLVARLPA